MSSGPISQEVTGDIAGAASLRMTQPIGALMLAVRESEELCDDIYEIWVHDSQVVHWALHTASPVLRPHGRHSAVCVSPQPADDVLRKCPVPVVRCLLSVCILKPPGMHAWRCCRPEMSMPHHMQLLCMQASLPQTVAAMRFILAYQNCTTGQAGGPLTEEEFLARLHDWATTEPTPSGYAPEPLSSDLSCAAHIMSYRDNSEMISNTTTHCHLEPVIRECSVPLA